MFLLASKQTEQLTDKLEIGDENVTSMVQLETELETGILSDWIVKPPGQEDVVGATAPQDWAAPVQM